MKNAADIFQFAATTVQARERILEVAASHPRASVCALSRVLSGEDGAFKVAVLVKALGKEYARQIFDGLSRDEWRVIEEAGQACRKRIQEAPAAEVLMDVLLEMTREAMLDDATEEEQDPFEFLRKADPARRRAVLPGVELAKLSLIAAYWTESEVAGILEDLPRSARPLVVLHASRLQRLPRAIVSESAARFAQELQAVFGVAPQLNHALPVVPVASDDRAPDVIARVLGSGYRAEEAKILADLEGEFPELRRAVRGFESEAVYQALEAGIEEASLTDASVLFNH